MPKPTMALQDQISGGRSAHLLGLGDAEAERKNTRAQAEKAATNGPTPWVAQQDLSL
jgi:hypothetical protein